MTERVSCFSQQLQKILPEEMSPIALSVQHVGNFDCVAEEERWRERHRHRHIVSTVGRQNAGQAVHG